MHVPLSISDPKCDRTDKSLTDGWMKFLMSRIVRARKEKVYFSTKRIFLTKRRKFSLMSLFSNKEISCQQFFENTLVFIRRTELIIIRGGRILEPRCHISVNILFGLLTLSLFEPAMWDQINYPLFELNGTKKEHFVVLCPPNFLFCSFGWNWANQTLNNVTLNSRLGSRNVLFLCLSNLILSKRQVSFYSILEYQTTDGMRRKN